MNMNNSYYKELVNIIISFMVKKKWFINVFVNVLETKLHYSLNIRTRSSYGSYHHAALL